MHWYAIYRFSAKPLRGPATGIKGPYSSERAAYLKLASIEEEVPNSIPWDVYNTDTSSPYEALLEFIGRKKKEYAGGVRYG